MKNKRFVAYDSDNSEFEQFDTYEEAVAWLNEGQEEGLGADAIAGYNYIAEIKWHSVYHETDRKENYHAHSEDCPEDCEEEEWPYDSTFDRVGVIEYEEIEYPETV